MYDTSLEGNKKLGLLGGGGPDPKSRGGQMVAAAAKKNKEKGVTRQSKVHPIHQLPPDSPTSSTAATVSVTSEKAMTPKFARHKPATAPSPARSPAPSITSSLDQRLVGLLSDEEPFYDEEMLERASQNEDLEFQNHKNQCSLTSVLHLLLAQQEIKDAILGKKKTQI